MEYGALVMMDALGFKGIWNRHKQFDVIDVLTDLRSRVQQELKRQESISRENQGLLFQTLRAEFLSDTVVLGVTLKKQFDQVRSAFTPALLSVAASTASNVSGAAAMAPIPLAYRGCVTLGEFRIEEDFIVGPAVDAAAAVMNSAQGAFVWLAPSALNSMSLHPDWTRTIPSVAPLIPYVVPLKGGDAFHSYVVSPFGHNPKPEIRKAIRDGISRSFAGSDAMDVAVKRQHTVGFLEALERFYADAEAQCGDRGTSPEPEVPETD